MRYARDDHWFSHNSWPTTVIHEFVNYRLQPTGYLETRVVLQRTDPSVARTDNPSGVPLHQDYGFRGTRTVASVS